MQTGTEKPLEPWERAEVDAQKTHPLPRTEPLTGAIFGGVATFLILEVFVTLAGLRDTVGEVPIMATMVLGAGLPALYLWWARRRHYAEASRMLQHHLALDRME